MSGSWFCSLRVVGTELALLPGESLCVFLSYVFLWLRVCFSLFPTDPGKIAVYLRLFVVVVKDGKKMRIVRAGVGAVIVLGWASVLLDF